MERIKREINPEEEVNYRIQRLKHLLADWHDEQPDHIIDSLSSDQDKNFKFRKTWFIAIAGELGEIRNDVRNGWINMSTEDEMILNDYIKMITSSEYAFQREVAQDDVDTAKIIIDRMIAILEGKL